MSGLGGLREEGMENLLDDEGRGITSVEEGLSEVSGADTPPSDGHRSSIHNPEDKPAVVTGIHVT